MKRSRVLYFHEKVNESKILALEALHKEYRRYLQTCIDTMIVGKRSSVPNGEILRFFPTEKILSTNIAAACQRHAVETVKSWSAALYTRKLQRHIKILAKENSISDAEKIQLFTIGKYSISKPTETISQKAIDFYWQMALDKAVSGKTPTASPRIGMRCSIHTSTLKLVGHTRITMWWLGLSTLNKYETIKIPLAPNPHLKDPSLVSHGCLVRKDRRGRWRVEVLEKKGLGDQQVDPNAPKIGVDVGLNCIAATSNGRLYGTKVKPKFDRLYNVVKSLRANRQRQGLKESSKKLDRLEDKLSGFVKTATGTVANRLVKDFPDHTFVIEDLDLRGCRGQKRFAYRALHHSLEKKAAVEVANPAFTSQMCPSCGYISRSNRSGTKFHCRSCGRKGHADGVGGLNLLGRSEDQEIQLDDSPLRVKEILKERFLLRRTSSKDSQKPSCELAARGSLTGEILTQPQTPKESP